LASCRCICRAGARRDLVDVTAGAHAAGLYTNLITSAVGITEKRLGALAEAGLDHVQISIQDSDAQSADHIAGYAGAFVRKRALAVEVVRHKLLLTVNAVVHRANIDRIAEMVDLALALGASRIEIAHVQYYGWALRNRAALMPSREQVQRAAAAVDKLRSRHHGRIVIDAVVPDYYARYPKPCVGGWGRRSLNVTPAGKVLPCHAAESITGLEFWNVRDRSLAYLGELPCLQRLPRHRLDEGAVRKLPAPRAGFRWLPLSGLRAHRRCHRNGPGVPPRSRPHSGRGARGPSNRCSLRLPPHASRSGRVDDGMIDALTRAAAVLSW
jgi:MoaA/NifB/PqqE/SkfB family radical SAM enzyme